MKVHEIDDEPRLSLSRSEARTLTDALPILERILCKWNPIDETEGPALHAGCAAGDIEALLLESNNTAAALRDDDLFTGLRLRRGA